MSLLLRNPNIYYGMGRKRRRRRHGGSIFGTINNFLKKHKIISTIGSALGGVGVPYAGAIGNAAKFLGYGRRRRRRHRASGLGRRRRVYRRRVYHRRRRVGVGRRRRVYRRRRGGNLKSILSSAHKFVKDNRLVSKGLRAFGHPKLAAASHSLGYGRRRTYRRHRYGGANYFSTSQIAVPRF